METSTRLVALSASEAVAAIREGELSAEQYAHTLMTRARSLDFLNALISQSPRDVICAAREADARQRAGEPLGPLHGLPVLLKDNINTIDLPTSGGTPALAGNFPAANAEIVNKLEAAGAIVFGKSNVHELTFGITSNNSAFGPVRNPYHPGLIAGGSSGGNGAAVAARMVAASIGTDTGGSTRIPAALCGIAGFRPTVGRYPGTGGETETQFVPISHTRDTPGPMARNVQDIALLDAVIADSDPVAAPANLAGLRLGLARRSFFSSSGAENSIDPAVATIVEGVLELLTGLGVELVEAEASNVMALNAAVKFPVVLFEAFNIDLPAYLALNAPQISVSELIARVKSPDVKYVLETVAPTVSETEYLDALAVRSLLQAAYAHYFASNSVEALIFPTTLLPARPIGHDATVDLNGTEVDTLATYLRNTDPAGNAGIPGLSIPAGLTPEGLPVGVELDGPMGSDRRLLAIGLAVENAINLAFGTLPAPQLHSHRPE